MNSALYFGGDVGKVCSVEAPPVNAVHSFKAVPCFELLTQGEVSSCTGFESLLSIDSPHQTLQ